MLASPSFLADMVMPSASAAMSRTMSRTPDPPARLAFADEPGVLGEPAGVEEERLAVTVSQTSRHAAQVLQAHRLPAAGVVRHGDITRGTSSAALLEQRLESVQVHVALERVLELRDAALGDDEVDRLGAGELDVGAGGVEVGVVRDDLAGPADTANRIFSAARPWCVGMTCL
jgi:hypothetical protein